MKKNRKESITEEEEEEGGEREEEEDEEKERKKRKRKRKKCSSRHSGTINWSTLSRQLNEDHLIFALSHAMKIFDVPV